MPGYRKAKMHDTLTFVNEDMTYKDVMEIFEIFGAIKYVNKYMNRFFVQFENAADARKAQSKLGRIYRVTFAHAKSYPRPKKNYRQEGELIRIACPASLPTSGYTTESTSSNGMAMIQEYLNSTSWKHTPSISKQRSREMARGSENLRDLVKSSRNQLRRSGEGNQHGQPASPGPNLSPAHDPEYDDSDDSEDFHGNIEEAVAQGHPMEDDEDDDSEEEVEEEENDDQEENEEEEQQEEAHAVEQPHHSQRRVEELEEIMRELGSDTVFSVIIANIPEKYNLEEVYDLVEEVKPIAFSEMDYSTKMRVKFCEVFVNDNCDVNYLKRKLNDFVICGKQLTVMEPDEILDETKWKA